MCCSTLVQDDVEPIKCSIYKGLNGAVQDVQDMFILRIYKSKKSLNFNDSLKNIYNRKKTSYLEPCTIKNPRNPVKSRVLRVQNVLIDDEPT